jgi:hypothetical protein
MEIRGQPEYDHHQRVRPVSGYHPLSIAGGSGFRALGAWRNLPDRDRELTTIVDGDGNPWWVSKEVCAVLGYANSPDTVAKPSQSTVLTHKK